MVFLSFLAASAAVLIGLLRWSTRLKGQLPANVADVALLVFSALAILPAVVNWDQFSASIELRTRPSRLTGSYAWALELSQLEQQRYADRDLSGFENPSRDTLHVREATQWFSNTHRFVVDQDTASLRALLISEPYDTDETIRRDKEGVLRAVRGYLAQVDTLANLEARAAERWWEPLYVFLVPWVLTLVLSLKVALTSIRFWPPTKPYP